MPNERYIERKGTLSAGVRALIAGVRALIADVRAVIADVRALLAGVRAPSAGVRALIAGVRASSVGVRASSAGVRASSAGVRVSIDGVCALIADGRLYGPAEDEERAYGGHDQARQGGQGVPRLGRLGADIHGQQAPGHRRTRGRPVQEVASAGR